MLADVTNTLDVRDLGRIGYAQALALQEQLVSERLAGRVGDTLLLLEHPPVITLGRRGQRSDIYASDSLLATQGIEVHQATRGGLVTYHGPGQLVGYPIVSLRPRKLTVPCYVRALESAIISCLADLGIAAFIRDGYVGVFTSAGKIAAIGVGVRHGVTMHGFALNLQPDLSHFNLINPCGIAELGVTSAARLLGHPVDMAALKPEIASRVEAHLAQQSCSAS